MGAFQLPGWAHPDFRSKRNAYSANLEINTDSPLARGLVGCYVPTPAGMFDLVTRKFGTKQGAWDFRQGMAYYNGGGGDNEFFDSPVSGASSWTIGCNVFPLANSTDRRFMALGNAATNIMIGLGTGNNIASRFRVFVRGDDLTTNSHLGVFGSDLFAGITSNTLTVEQGGLNAYHNGSHDGAINWGGTGVVTLDYLSFGAVKRGTISNPCKCRVSLGWAFDRILTAGEIKALHANPDQLVRPRSPVSFLFSASESTTPVTQSVDLRWSMLQAISGSSDIRWDVLAGIQQAADLRWSVLQAISQAADIRWDALSAVQRSADIRWSALEKTAKAADVRWNLVEAIASSADIRWDLLASIQSATDLRWALLEAISSAADIRWDMLAGLQKSADIRWSIIRAISNSADIRWDVLSALQSIAQSVDIRWSLRETVSQQADIRWNILNAVTAAIDAKWSVLQSIGLTADLRWSLINSISAQLSAQWDSLEQVSQSGDFRWDALNSVAGTLDIDWSVLEAVDNSITLQWNVGVINTFRRESTVYATLPGSTKLVGTIKKTTLN